MFNRVPNTEGPSEIPEPAKLSSSRVLDTAPQLEKRLSHGTTPGLPKGLGSRRWPTAVQPRDYVAIKQKCLFKALSLVVPSGNVTDFTVDERIPDTEQRHGLLSNSDSSGQAREFYGRCPSLLRYRRQIHTTNTSSSRREELH